MTIGDANKRVNELLQTIYPPGEVVVMGDWLMESVTGLRKTTFRLKADLSLDKEQENKFEWSLQRLLHHEPIQYVLNEAWFCGLKFYVDQNVLIPRPETEELVEWIISNCRFPVDELSILDIGSGSGCIPIALKRRIRKALVYGLDISKGTIDVAEKNAVSLGADVRLMEINFLDSSTWKTLPRADIIVSNPPYVPEQDKQSMSPNVLEFEPHTSLFVPDHDPLVFYRAIGQFGLSHLNKSGEIYLEIHENHGGAVLDLFKELNYTTEIKKDLQGKNRMVRAVF